MRQSPQKKSVRIGWEKLSCVAEVEGNEITHSHEILSLPFFTIAGCLVSAPSLLFYALVSSREKVSELDGRSCPVLLKWKGIQIIHSHKILSLSFFENIRLASLRPRSCPALLRGL